MDIIITGIMCGIMMSVFLFLIYELIMIIFKIF